MKEEFIFVGYRANELLYRWRGAYWRWTRSPMTKGDPAHVFEEIVPEMTEWILYAQAIY